MLGSINVHDVLDILNVVGLVLAVAGLFLAWLHLRDLKHVQDSLSTRYIGQFPENMDEVVSLVDSAKRSLTIVCDVPAYCVFTRPELGLAYKQAIERKRNQPGFKSIKFISLDALCTTKFHHEQLDSDTNDATKWKDFLLEMKPQLESLTRSNPAVSVSNPLTTDEFFRLLDSAQDRMRRDVLATWNPIGVNTTMPIYFWIADDFHAILAIPVLANGVTEICFTTDDERIVKALLGVAARMERSAAPANPVPSAAADAIPPAA